MKYLMFFSLIAATPSSENIEKWRQLFPMTKPMVSPPPIPSPPPTVPPIVVVPFCQGADCP